MASSHTRCRKCGTKFAGRGDLCLTCLPASSALGHVAKKSQGSSKKTAVPGTPVCPYCRTEVTWDNMGTSETEVTIYVREKMYYCSHCRALLGFSSWHTEG